MPGVRSPSYPYIDLDSAIAHVETIYNNEDRAPFTKEVFASHCGYKSYNGSAAKVLAALKKFKLIEKHSLGFKLSDDALTIVALKGVDTDGVRARKIEKSALSVGLFASLVEDIGYSASETNLVAQLKMRGFTKDGAAKAAKTYLSTMALVASESGGYDASPEVDLAAEEEKEETPVPETNPQQPIPTANQTSYSPPTSMADVHTEVFNLDDGRVVIEYPNELSVESYEDLSDYMELFLRKLKRRITQ